MSNIKVQKSNGNETYDIQKMYAYYAENSEAVGRKSVNQLKTDIINSSLYTQDKIIDEDFNIKYIRDFDSNISLPQNYNFLNTAMLKYELNITTASLSTYRESSSNFGALIFGFVDSGYSTSNCITLASNTPITLTNFSFTDNLMVRFRKEIDLEDNVTTSYMLLQTTGTQNYSYYTEINMDPNTGTLNSNLYFFNSQNKLSTSSIVGHLSIWAIKINL